MLGTSTWEPKRKETLCPLRTNRLEQNWMHTLKILQHQTASILFFNKNGSPVGFYFSFIFLIWKYILKIRAFSTKENVFCSQVESKHLEILDIVFYYGNLFYTTLYHFRCSSYLGITSSLYKLDQFKICVIRLKMYILYHLKHSSVIYGTMITILHFYNLSS